MTITKNTIKTLADRTTHPALVMPNLMSSSFVHEQTGSNSVETQLMFAERYGYVPYIEVSGLTSYSAGKLAESSWNFHTTLLSLGAILTPELRFSTQSAESEKVIKYRRSLKTPHGTLSEVTRFHTETQLTEHVEKLIKTKKDLDAMAWLVRECLRAIDTHRTEIREQMVADLLPIVTSIRGNGLSCIHFWTPAEEVLYPFFDQVDMIYAMHDEPLLLKELMNDVMAFSYLLVDVGADVGVDSLQTAIWGYEQWSPTIYREFVLPYAVPLGNEIHKRGLLFWIHTCGYMKGLLEQRIYHEFEAIDILECLNEPPAGDVDDWPRLRALVPEETVTKGNLEDSLLWNGNPEDVRSKTFEILRASEKFAHIIATSNNVFSGTPLCNFEAIIEAVREYNGNE